MSDRKDGGAHPMDGWDGFIVGLQRLENEAHIRGLHATAHAINEAKNKAGYEQAEACVKANALLAERSKQ